MFRDHAWVISQRSMRITEGRRRTSVKPAGAGTLLA
jgi:hypothetical protein